MIIAITVSLFLISFLGILKSKRHKWKGLKVEMSSFLIQRKEQHLFSQRRQRTFVFFALCFRVPWPPAGSFSKVDMTICKQFVYFTNIPNIMQEKKSPHAEHWFPSGLSHWPPYSPCTMYNVDAQWWGGKGGGMSGEEWRSRGGFLWSWQDDDDVDRRRSGKMMRIWNLASLSSIRSLSAPCK